MFQLYGKSLDFSQTAVYYLICITLGIMLAIPGPTLLDLQRSVGEEASTHMGFVFTSRSIGYLMGSLIGGVVLDFFRYGEVALILSSLCLAIGAFIIPWCRSFAQLLLTFSVIGFTMGFSNTGSNACCLNIWGPKGAPIIQGLHFFFGLGGLLAPLLATAFLHSKSAHPDLSLLPASQNYTSDYEFSADAAFSEKSGDIEQVLKGPQTVTSIIYIYSAIGVFTMFVSATSFIVFLLSSKENPKLVHSNRNNVRSPSLFFTLGVVLLAALQVGLISSVEISFSQLLTSYVVQGSHKLSLATGYIMTSTYWGTFTFARALTIAIALKVRTINILRIDFIILMSGIIILLTMGAYSVNALWAGTCIIGFGVASFFPGTLSWIEKYVNINNKVVSVFTVITSLFEMTVPMIVNFYLQSKPNILFQFMFGATVVSCLIFQLLRTILNKTGEKYQPENQTRGEDCVLDTTSC